MYVEDTFLTFVSFLKNQFTYLSRINQSRILPMERLLFFVFLTHSQSDFAISVLCFPKGTLDLLPSSLELLIYLTLGQTTLYVYPWSDFKQIQEKNHHCSLHAHFFASKML